MSRLQGKRAVVTGAASGIGRATAIRFATEGAAVVVCDLDREGLDETVRSIEAVGGRCLSIAASAADQTVVAGLVRESVDRHGGLEIFHANAGISGLPKSIFDTELDEWREILEVNLLGVFLGIKHAATHMRDAGGGSIICTASVAGLRAAAGPIPYSASKAGVISLVQTTAASFTGLGIRVNAICPGLIQTGMTKPIFDYAKARGSENRIGQLNPLQRHGIPEEVAQVAVFLASDESSYVNGHAIVVDGGLSTSHPFVPMQA